MDLGEYTQCLKVASLEESLAFYAKLGFVVIDDHRQDRWLVLRHNNLILSLFEGHIDRNLINFRGGDVAAIAAEALDRGVELLQAAHMEEDGSWSAEVVDPDGNHIYFNTFPDERAAYLAAQEK